MIAMMADRADGTINPKPTIASHWLGVVAYTCFQIIQAPNPIRMTSRKLFCRNERHFTFTSFPQSVCFHTPPERT
jgi:hypothetical protein